ncbi:unnamed protein product [Somion occarium]|uniref:Nuclease HARBI1 n=1 Tax=Somion occarium TaxID=3059160 RepID=A0ABP1D3R0_9APHY
MRKFPKMLKAFTFPWKTQLGAACHLEERIRTCLQFWEQTLQHSQLIPPANMDVICSSIHDMLTRLQAAKLQSSDTADMDALEPAKLVYTGCPGRPRVEFNCELLAVCLQYRGVTELGKLFGTSARTVHRAAIALGLAEPALPVYFEFTENGVCYREYFPAPSTPSSSLSDNELDLIMAQILQSFPSFGRHMIDGHLTHLGHTVSRARVQASYA